MKKVNWIVIFALLLTLLVGCSDEASTENNENLPEEKVEQNVKTAEAANEEEQLEQNLEVSNGVNEEEQAVEASGDTIINDFIAAYNNVAEVQITNTSSFEPQDKESGHYRTEFRLGAWNGSVGTTAAIGNSAIDIVCYGSHGGIYENKNLRIYVTSPSVDEIFEIFKIATKVLDDTVTGEEIQEVIDDVNEYGDYNGFVIGNMEPGTIIISKDGCEMMLTIEG